MDITINGQPHQVPEGLTLSGLLAHLDLNGPVAIERNAEVVPRVDHAATTLVAGDVLEIVHFVGGG
ncbi:MAG TPA: sulfur carrier protein ThiS [Polyangiaceae bacterium]|nr:sulfur carrier protein ThiS [Polyangiaceae bacterium]